jgi:hypothetical protein
MSRLWTALAFVVVTAAALVLTLPRTAETLPCNDSFMVFYSDCTYTVEVGWEYHSCQGGTTGQGSQSPYFWREVTCCQDQNPCCSSGTG